MAFSHLPLTHPVNRAANRRSEPGLLANLLGDQDTLVLAIYDREVPVAPAGADATAHGAPRLHFVAPREVPTYLADHDETMWVYLGQVASREIVALVLPTTVGDQATAEWRAQFDWAPLRVFAEGATTREEYEQTEERAGLAVVAVALANWHSTSRFCGRCGGRTEMDQAGWTRVCTACGIEHFPRTDPAVIMAAVSEDDSILLGNAMKWEPNRFSTLAGFVEPGETLEAAVRREVMEEAGIVIGETTYLASQPWPFPASLMLGYYAHALTTDVTVDGTEIRAARWFTRTQLATAVETGEVRLPGVSSIARRLIEHWYGAAL